MASEFDAEVFRTLLLNLGDRLSNTRGDTINAERLKRIEDAIRRLGNSIDSSKPAEFNTKGLAEELSKVVSTEGINEDIAKSIQKGFDKVRLNTEQDSGSSGLSDIANDLTNSGGKFTAVLGKVSAGFSVLSGVTGKVAGALSNFSTNMDGTFAGAARAVGLTTGATATFAAFIDDNIDAYRKLQSASEGSIGSLGDMRRAMSTAAMGADEFASAIKNGTDGTRLIGGQNWANLYKSIKEQTQSMGMYGYSLSDLASAQNEYLGVLVSRGDIYKDSAEVQAQGFNSLLQVNSKVATILGKDRDDMLKRIAAEAQDANFNTYLNGTNMTTDQRNELSGVMAVAEQLGPQVSSMLKDLIMSGGVLDQNSVLPLLDAPMQQIFMSLAEKIRAGNIEQGDSVTLTQQLRQAANQRNPVGNQQMAIAGRLYGAQYEGANLANIAARNIRELTPDTTFGTEQTDEATNGLLGMEKAFKDTAAALQDTYTQLLNPAMVQFGGEIKGITDAIGGKGGWIDNIREGVQSLSGFNAAVLAAGGLFGAGVGISGITALTSAAFGAAVLPTIKKIGELLGGSTVSLSEIAKNFASKAAGGAKGAATGVAEGAVGAANGVKAVGKAMVEKTPGYLNSAASKSLQKVLGPVGAILEGLSTYGDIVDDYDRQQKGEITGEEFKKLLTQHIGGALGGLSGSLVGAQLLGALGAAGGSVVPGLGTVAGGAIGGIAGGIGGYYGGDYLGEQIGGTLYDLLLSDGMVTPATPSVSATPTGPAVETPSSVLPDAPAVTSTLDSVVDRVKDTNSALVEIQNILKTMLDSDNKNLMQLNESMASLVSAQEDIARKMRLGTI